MGYGDWLDESVVLHADFKAEPREVKVGEEIQFTDYTASTQPPLAYEWDFDNDGEADSTDENPTWHYDEPGTYTVKLKVTDSQGNESEEVRENYVTVQEAAPPAAGGLCGGAIAGIVSAACITLGLGTRFLLRRM